MKTLAIIGAGMSGMVAAVVAARNHKKVYLFERQEKVGKKLLLTGNGRCNLSNRDISSKFYVCSEETVLENTFSVFSTEEEKKFWDSLGVLTKEKNGGVYPVSNQASTVVNALKNQLKKSKVEVICDCLIEEIKTKENRFYLIGKDKKWEVGQVIMACGGMAGCYKEESYNGYRIARNLGHKVNFCYPALVQTKCGSENFKMMQGVRCDARVALYIENEFMSSEMGELQITEHGLSGIPIFQLTRYMGEPLKNKKRVEIVVDLASQYSDAEWDAYIKKRFLQFKGQTAEAFLTGLFNDKIHTFFMEKYKLLPDLVLKEENFCEKILPMTQEMKHWKVAVTGLNSFKHAQVSTGGVDLSEVTFNFESKLYPGLYFTGEMLDITGACGGYNLYFAAASGYIAGKHCIEEK